MKAQEDILSILEDINNNITEINEKFEGLEGTDSQINDILSILEDINITEINEKIDGLKEMDDQIDDIRIELNNLKTQIINKIENKADEIHRATDFIHGNTEQLVIHNLLHNSDMSRDDLVKVILNHESTFFSAKKEGIDRKMAEDIADRCLDSKEILGHIFKYHLDGLGLWYIKPRDDK